MSNHSWCLLWLQLWHWYKSVCLIRYLPMEDIFMQDCLLWAVSNWKFLFTEKALCLSPIIYHLSLLSPCHTRTGNFYSSYSWNNRTCLFVMHNIATTWRSTVWFKQYLFYEISANNYSNIYTYNIQWDSETIYKTCVNLQFKPKDFISFHFCLIVTKMEKCI